MYDNSDRIDPPYVQATIRKSRIAKLVFYVAYGKIALLFYTFKSDELSKEIYIPYLYSYILFRQLL
jgi:hypothetical protein